MRPILPSALSCLASADSANAAAGRPDRTGRTPWRTSKYLRDYSEDTTVQVTAVDATTGATLANFTGTVNIAEVPAADGTTIYSQNGGSLVTVGGQQVAPAAINITAGGTATFVAQSLAGPSVEGPNGSKPNDAVIQTTNYPL